MKSYMKFRMLLIAAMMLLSVTMSAQIHGTVVDDNDEPISGVVVIASVDGEVKGAATTSDEGDFALAAIEADGLVMEFSHLSYETKTLVLPPSDAADFSVGKVILKHNTIEEAVIRADFIRRRGMNTIVSLKNNPDAKGRNTLQFLNTLPGVNGINIHGKGSSKVFVNNREMKMNPQELMQYLAGLKATDVQTIHIMPNDGARYSGDHKGGIIRIQLRSGGDPKFSGSLTVPMTVALYDGSISSTIPFTLNYTANKFSSYTYLNGSYLQNEHKKTKTILENAVDENSIDRSFAAFTLDQSFVYDISKKHSLGFAFNGMYKPYETGRTAGASSVLDERISFGRSGGSLSYDWKIDERGSGISVVGDYLFRRDRYASEYSVDDKLAEVQNNITDKHTYSLKVDGEYAFRNEMSSLSMGVFYLGMNAGEDYAQYGVANRFDYREGLYGAYAEFYTPLFDYLFDLDFGLRYEGANIDWEHSATERASGRDWFNDIFPNFELTYNYMNINAYTSLSYDRYIDRPIMSDYDPVVYRESDNVFYVSPDRIAPQFENTISLTQGFGKNHLISLSYIWQKDIFDEVYANQGDKLIVSDANVGSSRQLNLYADTQFWLIKKWLAARFTGTFDYTHYFHDVYGTVKSLGANVSGLLQLKLPKAWLMNLSANYSTPRIYPTYRMSENWGLNFSIRKTIKDKYILQLSANDILYNKNLITKSRIEGVEYETINSLLNRRNITFTFTYNFGSEKNHNAKRAKRNYEVNTRSGGR